MRNQTSASSGKGRARAAISTAIAIERIEKMTQGVIQDVQRALALQAALEVGNDTIRELRGDGPALSFYGAYAYEEIRFGLIASLALTLAKLFDPVTLFLPPAMKKRRSVNKSDIYLNPSSCQAAKATQVSNDSGEACPRLDAYLGGHGGAQ